MFPDLFDPELPSPGAAQAALLRGQPLPTPQSMAQRIAEAQARQAAALREQQAAYQPVDPAPMTQAYQRQAQGGGDKMMLALAAAEAGKEMQPFQAQFLKQAAEARSPMKMAGGTMTDTGFIEDPTYKQNLAIQRADAKVKQYDTALQNVLSEQSRQDLQRERDKAMQEFRREMQRERLHAAQVLKGMSGGVDGLERATMEGYTPEGKRVVTDRSGVPYVVDVVNGKPTQAVYSGQIIPKATHEKNVATATEHLASAESAAGLLKQLDAVDPKNFGWRGKAASMSPDFLKTEVAGVLDIDPQARDTAANIMSMAAEKIKEMYGAAQSAGEAERAKTFLPTQGDDLPTLKIKLRAAEKWGRDHAARTGGAALGAASSRSGMPAVSAPTASKKAPPAVGEVRGGYTFKGGDPADPKNWSK